MTRKQYFIFLWILGAISTIAVYPFSQVVALLTGNSLMDIELTNTTIMVFLLEGTVVHGIVLFFGMKFADKIGAKFLLMRSGVSWMADLFRPAIIGGILCSATVLLVDYLLPISSLTLGSLIMQTPPLYGLLAVAGGVVSQEVLLCLLIISGIALLFKKLFKTADMNTVMPISIGISAFLFGVMHLPTFINIMDIGNADLVLVVRVIMLNIITGTTFGMLFWKKGFETAVLAHLIVDTIFYILISSVIRTGFFSF